MNLRQKIQIILLAFLILFAFASYHEGSGSTIWLQWLAIIAIMTYMFIFDVAFTNESSFIFDPDAENWRRKTVRDAFGNMMILQQKNYRRHFLSISGMVSGISMILCYGFVIRSGSATMCSYNIPFIRSVSESHWSL